MEAKHDGEGAGGQHLLVVVVVQAVSSCQGISVANLRRMDKAIALMKMIGTYIGLLYSTYYDRAALAVDVVSL